ncbi:MAG: cyclase family protein [Spirochaetaceae bacterium]|jgi:arylformamidase|nr:cyclase family protein [Spirochaetaceae bacterium]
MTVIDITRVVQEAPLYPGTPVPSVERLSDVNKGDPYSVSKFVFTSHLGTHADAFSHFLPGPEADTIDRLPLDYFYGPARVVTVPSDTLITRECLLGRLDSAERVVVHGGGRSYFSKEAVDYLVERGIKTVITDAWSVAPPDNETIIHQTLFQAKIAVVENVILDGVADGDYLVVAFPLKIKGSDGAPVRAALITSASGGGT